MRTTTISLPWFLLFACGGGPTGVPGSPADEGSNRDVTLGADASSQADASRIELDATATDAGAGDAPTGDAALGDVAAADSATFEASSDPCAALAPGSTCRPGLTCSDAKQCTCGNGRLDPGEMCDRATPTCSASCSIQCENDGDCPAPIEICAGISVCARATHTCHPGSPLPVGSSCSPRGDFVCTGQGICREGHKISGTVRGFFGEDPLLLQTDAGDSLSIQASGPFTFPMRMPRGHTYTVRVTSPARTARCTVTGATGTIGTTDVSNVDVSCTMLTGETESLAAPSCASIRKLGPTFRGVAANKTYWVTPGLQNPRFSILPTELYCDMTYDGGGWMLVGVLHKGQSPLAQADEYSTVPVHTPNDPGASFLASELFFRAYGSGGHGEWREEIAVSGGIWPNNTHRVVHWGRDYDEDAMARARTAWGYAGRATLTYEDLPGRSSYLGTPSVRVSRHSGIGTSTVLGIAVDADPLNADRGTTDGTHAYTNEPAAGGHSWAGRGNCCGMNPGSSTNGAEPDGTRWALLFIR